MGRSVRCNKLHGTEVHSSHSFKWKTWSITIVNHIPTCGGWRWSGPAEQRSYCVYVSSEVIRPKCPADTIYNYTGKDSKQKDQICFVFSRSTSELTWATSFELWVKGSQSMHRSRLRSGGKTMAQKVQLLNHSVTTATKNSACHQNHCLNNWFFKHCTA